MGDVIRPRAWTPIVVDLTSNSPGGFEGYLRVEHADRDGDPVYDEVLVQLTGEAGIPRRYELYYIPGWNESGGSRVSVSVLDSERNSATILNQSDGALVTELQPAQPPEQLPDNSYLILELSHRVTGRVADLTSRDQQHKYQREIVLAHESPDALPSHWIGLEGVDAIVWEDADATELSQKKIEALVEWVRQGGLLLIASSEHAGTLTATKELAPLMRIELGDTRNTERLPVLRNKLLDVPTAYEETGSGTVALEEQVLEGDPGPYYERPFPVARFTCLPGATAVITEPDLGGPIIAEWPYGHGRVVFVGARLFDLMAEREAGLKRVEFFRKVLKLRQNRFTGNDFPEEVKLFPRIDEMVGFRRSTGMYLLAAVLFSIAYVGVATFGSWGLLRKKGLTRHSWTVFALVACAATALSMATVQGIRGYGQHLQQLSIVDATAGKTAATATAYFGIKTATFTRLDVWLPVDYTQADTPEPTNCTLKPILEFNRGGDSQRGYTDPTRYQSVPAEAEIVGAPIRATLKQFEGRWQGDLRRTLNANLVVGPMADDNDVAQGVQPGSFVTNNLGHGLENCFLLIPLEYSYRSFVDQSPRAGRIMAFPVGRIAASETLDLADRVYLEQPGGMQLPVKEWRERTLKELYKACGKQVLPGAALSFAKGSDFYPRLDLEPYESALLLATAMAEHDPLTLQAGLATAGYDFRIDPFRHVDCSTELEPGTALLVGFADDQGPVMLCTRTGNRGYDPLIADQARTMYRFRIPFETP
jgi:hypothetical protein